MRIEWIREALKRPGKSQRGLAKALGIAPSGVSRLLSGQRALKAAEIEIVQAYLDDSALGPKAVPGTLPDKDEFGDPDAPPEALAHRAGRLRAGFSPIPGSVALERDLPVLGVAPLGHGDAFVFDGEVIDFAPRAPGLVGEERAFALYLPVDAMSPCLELDALIFVHPGRTARPGDNVLVQFLGRRGCFVRRLLRRTPLRATLVHFKSDKAVVWDLKDVKSMHRILGVAELIGA